MRETTRIQRLGRLLEFGCYVLIGLAGASMLGMVLMLFISPDSLVSLYHESVQATVRKLAAATPVFAIPALMLFLLPSLANMYAYWRLSRFFVLIRGGSFFSHEGVNHLFVFAMINFLEALLSTPVLGLANVVASIGTGQPIDGMPLILNGDELPGLILPGTFVLVAWILREAVSLAEENASFL